MNNQEILDNAPEGATHIDGGEYLDATTASYWSLAKSKWCGVDELILQDDIRSLADIKRIVELEKELSKVKAYKAQLLAHVKYTSTQEEVEIIKLEQQAKGVYNLRATTGFWDLSTCLLRTHLREYEVILKNKAKALKEQVK